MRKGLRMMLIILSTILAGVVALALLFLAISPGQPVSFNDGSGKPLKGSISEKAFIKVNGVKQGMFIKGKNENNPVLLYLHGGMPEYFLNLKYPSGLEEYFTVVWWEQRGSGISYSDSIPRASMTLDRMISDTRVVTDYLRARFGHEKIYLMGHSGGTFIAIQAAERMPELYHAYIGVAQMSRQLESEKLAYKYMLGQFKENGNKSMVRKLEAAPIDNDVTDAYLSVRDEAMHTLGVGTMHDMHSVITGVFLPSLACRDYTVTEKVNTWRGKARSGVSCMWEEMMVTDLTERVPELTIPVYFLHGVHDYTVSYPLARDYFENLKAPVKGFYTFDNSAHSPMFEEPGKLKRIMQEDVLIGANNLADVR